MSTKNSFIINDRISCKQAFKVFYLQILFEDQIDSKFLKMVAKQFPDVKPFLNLDFRYITVFWLSLSINKQL